MYLAIIILPLLGSIVSGFFGRKIGVNGAQILTIISVLITTFFAIVVFFEVAFNNISVDISLFRWIDLELFNVLWEFNFDFLTVSMLIPVLVISSLVHVYSVGYMSHDPHNQRFFSYLSLFTFMMIILVTSNNFILMFVGWEGVGICSYLLVNFWFTRIAANQSSVSAFLTNRVGDCFLTIGMFIILLTFGNLDYSTVFSLAPFINEDGVTIIGICLLIGAMAKSSQIGLHVWLPLAMEGPTPVSALIHAATMVTAGVYLLMRTSPLIEYSSTVLLTSLWIGSITTVFSSVIGLFQQDIKKVIAYSTMSQLGMMVIAIGLSSYNVALFHLVNHAFYKGLLFLGAGAVIHAVADNQDFRKYGGLILFLPLSYTVMLIASLSLVAFPFMTGFYSKDFILESSFAQFNYSSIAVYFTAIIGAIFTTLYSVKVLYLTFITRSNAPVIIYNKTHESDVFMSLPLVILALFSIYFGYITKDIFIGIGSHAFTDNSLFIHPNHETSLSSEFAVSHFFKLLPFILTIIISILSLVIFEFIPNLILSFKYTRIGYNIFAYLNLKFLVECIYNRFITYFILNIGGKTTKILDKGSVEKIGPYGLETFLMFLSKNLNALNTGVVTTYALYILIGFMSYLSLPYLLSKDPGILFVIMFSGILFLVNTASLNTNILSNIISNENKSDFNVVKSSIDPDTAYAAVRFTIIAISIPLILAGSRKIYNWSENLKINYQKNNENIVDELSDNVTQVENKTEITENFNPINWFFNDTYSPAKWICDIGDIGNSHPYITVGLLSILTLSLPIIILWKAYRLGFEDAVTIADNQGIEFQRHEYDLRGNLVHSHIRWLMKANQRPMSQEEREFLGLLDVDLSQVFDQHNRYWLNGIVRTNTSSCAQVYTGNTQTGMPEFVVKRTITFLVRNYTPFRDWANNERGWTNMTGFFEIIVDHVEKLDLEVPDNFPFILMG